MLLLDTDHLFSQADEYENQGDYKRAFELFMKGALLNDTDCMSKIGYYYDLGLYVRKNKSKAMYWYKKAYRQYDIVSPINIAIIYEEKREWKKALWWFHKAVAMGNKDGFFHIASLYHRGRGVQRNIRTAINYYKKAYYSGEICESLEDKIERILTKMAAL